MSTGEDIVAFIQARLNEIEARVHDDIEWWFGECAISATNREGVDIAVADASVRPFIDPARVLPGIDVQRKVLALHDDQHECAGNYRSGQWPYPGCDTLRLLASEWSTHPDFRPEWTL